MNTDSVWEALSNLPIGIIIAWIVVFGIIGGGIFAGFVKLFQTYEKVRSKKTEYDEIRDGIKRHDNQIDEINKKLDNIIHILDKQDEQSRIELRHSIVRAGEEAIAEGKISIRKLRALHEMYEVYHKPDEHGVVGNGYVSTLMTKVDVLPVEGKLDENNNDV